jgi:RES domain-containing protein
MISAVRLTKSVYLSSAFSGQGAKDFGGRFNSIGTGLVYCSDCLPLAILEVLVHASGDLALVVEQFCWVPLRFDESLVKSLEVSQLPKDWNHSMTSSANQAIGDEWVLNGESAVLSVPSVIVPQHRNYLLNPSHPDFFRIKIDLDSAAPLEVDSRLLRDSD